MKDRVEVLERLLAEERLARLQSEKHAENCLRELEMLKARRIEEERLVHELEFMSQFPEQHNFPVMAIGMNGIIRYANKASQRLLRLWHTSIGDKCPPDIFIAIHKCFERKLPIKLEVPDRSVKKIYNFMIQPVAQYNCVFVYGYDITSLKKTRHALSENKNRYKQMVEEASDLIYQINLKGKFIYTNPASLYLSGYSQEELLGKSYFNLIREDHRERALLFYRQQLEQNTAESYFEFPIQSKTMGELWLGQNAKILYENGVAKGFHFVARNITDRKKTQQELENTSFRLKTLISNLQSGILLEDENRQIILANELFCKFFTIPLAPEQLKGMDCSGSAEQAKHLFKDPEQFVCRIAQILEKKELVLAEELELASGRFLKRDYIPVYNGSQYMGHLWKYTDISEKKQSETELKRQKEFYENILNHIPTDLVVFDAQHRYLFLNPEAIGNADTRNWIIGKNDFDYARYKGKSLAVAENRRAKFRQVVENRAMLKWEEEHITPAGERVYRLRHMCPIENEHGEITHVIGLGLNITNEKIIENELRKNEQRLRVINQLSYMLLTGKELNQTIQAAIESFNTVGGFRTISVYDYCLDQAESKYEMNYLFGLACSSEDSRLQQALLLKEVLDPSIIAQLSHGQFVKIKPASLAETKAACYMILPLMVQDHLWGTIVFEDTENVNGWNESEMDILFSFANTLGGAISRKEAEDKLTALVTSLDDIVLQINKDYEYEDIWVSKHYKVNFSKERYLHKSISEVFQPEFASMFEKTIDAVLDTKDIRALVYKTEQPETYYRFKICYLNATNVSVLVEDITAQKKAEAELVLAREKAEQSVKVKEHFLANMSHEIRTPMNAIVGMSRLLEGTRLNKQQQRYLKAISVSSSNLLVIINDILDFSKIESQKLVLEKIGFSVSEVVNNVVKTISYKAEEKNLYLDIAIDKRIKSIVIGDPARLNQILLNFANNALKFTHKGGVRIECNLDHETETTNKIRFSVSDTGIGIGLDKHDEIFESFTQEDETITRRYGGTGLGLSICKQLVELQGGKIELESVKDQGTTFYFSLEYAIGTEQDLPVRSLLPGVGNDLENVRVLLVEDNEINSFLAQTILENRKMQVETAENGLVALSKLKEEKFDVVLMDMQMPVMGGVEASRIIREEMKLAIPIIALTANAIKGDDLTCLKAGMNDYISKPFEEAELLAKIAGLLNKKPFETETTRVASVGDKELYSLEKLEDLSDGNKGFVKKMTKLFIEVTYPVVSQLKTHFENQNYEEVKAIAHTIRPSIDYLSISSIYEELLTIEKMSYETAENLSMAAQYIDHISETVEKVIRNLEKYAT